MLLRARWGGKKESVLGKKDDRNSEAESNFN